VPTFYDPRRRVSERILKAIQKGFGKMVTHPIHIDTKLSEAPGVGKSIFEYAPKSRAAVDYARLTERVATMEPVEERHLAPMLVTS
jgi:chromosome partitioning protein